MVGFRGSVWLTEVREKSSFSLFEDSLNLN